MNTKSKHQAPLFALRTTVHLQTLSLGMGKDPNALARRRIVELKNGRLAMIAFGGVIHQQLLTKQGTLEQLANFKAHSPFPHSFAAGEGQRF